MTCSLFDVPCELETPNLAVFFDIFIVIHRAVKSMEALFHVAMLEVILLLSFSLIGINPAKMLFDNN